MAWTTANSWIPSATMRDALNNAIALNLATDVHKVFLLGQTITATIDTDSTGQLRGNAAFGTEVTGTGWTVPVALSTPTMALITTPSHGVMFDAADVSVSSTTISTAAYGCAIYDSTISNTVGPVVAVVYFGGTGYTTNNGTFGIQWSTNGIYQITLQ
jgi:hypothetical protein